MLDILENLKSLGRAKLGALAAVGLGLVAAVYLGLNTVLAPTFTPLVREMSPASASRVVAALEQAGFNVSVSTDSATISVPIEDAPRARMLLAEAGLPDEGMPGWEIFDGGSGLGMNTFLQKVNRLRALEGELARSIQTIDGIVSARVHLVLPEREAFSRDQTEPSASVILRARSGATLNLRQAQSIRALVASAVPALAPGRVTVLSADGETILSEDTNQSAVAGVQSAKVEIEQRLASNIMSIVAARVGMGNARVQVNVDLSTKREVTRSERFDPEGQVLRSLETREGTTREQRTQAQEVGVAGNIPDPSGGTSSESGATNETSTTNEIRNYEIASTQTETMSEPGAVQRISVAVLVDGQYGTDGEGDATFTPRDAAELERLAKLVQAAIGFDPARGDTVSVDSLQFVDMATDPGPTTSALSTFLSVYLPSILRGAFALALTGAVLILGVRPAVRLVLEKAQQSAAANAERDEIAEIGQAPAPHQLAGPAAGGAAAASGALVPVASVRGGVSRESIDMAAAIVDQKREDAMRAVQGWLAAKA